MEFQRTRQWQLVRSAFSAWSRRFCRKFCSLNITKLFVSVYLKFRDNFPTFLKIALAWVGSYVVFKGTHHKPSSLIFHGSRPISARILHRYIIISLYKTNKITTQLMCFTGNLRVWLVLPRLSISWKNARCSLKGDYLWECFCSPSFLFLFVTNGITDVKSIFFKRKLRQFRNAAKTGHDLQFKYWSFFVTDQIT